MALLHLALLALTLVPAPDASVLDGLRAGHPRLILTDDRLAELKRLAVEDDLLARYVAEVLAQADRVLERPPLQHELKGPRLLHVSRECVQRIYHLGLAWRLTGNEAYATAALDNLLTVCAFPDWNPSHFLDTAEMSHAVGVGYDWLYPWLAETDRATIREGLVRLGLTPGREAYEKDAWWARSAFNWNQVCNAGLAVGALAIAEDDPRLAESIVAAAVASLPTALRSYSPDGAWMEGPGYWDYATRYTVYGLAAFDTALATDFGLRGIEGLAEAGCFPLHATGPTGLLLNYADSGSRARRVPLPCLFWLARAFAAPEFADAEHEQLATGGVRPEHVIWYTPPAGTGRAGREPCRLFEGRVPVAFFRSSWDDPDALFVGVKGGYNRVNHGHLDLGNFEIDALGVRWARDLGSDDYNLPGYWEGAEGGRRWRFYRLNSTSHSVPLIDGRNQRVAGEAAVVRFRADGVRPFVVLDLSTAYRPPAEAVRRGVALVAGRSAVLVQDEFALSAPHRLTWAMTTDAEIEVSRGSDALLALEGRSLRASILAPRGAHFTTESAERSPPERTNSGVRRLLVEHEASTGRATIAILLAPLPNEDSRSPAVELRPLAEW